MPKHRQGGKFSGSHTTVIEDAINPVDEAARLLCVTKICLGLIESVRSKKKRIKFKAIPAGWEVKVYSLISMQIIYVYTTDPVNTRQTMFKAFGA